MSIILNWTESRPIGLLYLACRHTSDDSIYARTWDRTPWSEAIDTGARSNGDGQVPYLLR